jgi:C1A family cysteine protease
MKKRTERAGRLIALGLAGIIAASMPAVCGWQSEVYADSTHDGMISQSEDNARDRMERVRKMGSNATAPTSSYGLRKSVASGKGLPSKFDLRDKGLVTPVKDQSPWGTCWSFGDTAAAEAAVLSDLGETYDSSGLDLSELHLAWFAFDPVKKGTDGSTSQKGEGIYYDGEFTGHNAWYKLDEGGDPFFGSLVYAQGTGPVFESTAPYRNTTGKIKSEDGITYYSDSDPWNVPENLRFRQCAALTDCSILPSFVKRNNVGIPTGEYSESALNAMKSEIYNGKPLSACCYSENVTSDQNELDYLNVSNYSMYTCDNIPSNHVVTIVGWDDDYSRDNFLSGRSESGRSRRPPKDGAWIVKNSWGSKDSEYPANYDWGTGGSGYFYISYYDKSLDDCTSLDFETNSGEKSTYGHVNQYDYMPDLEMFDMKFRSPASSANVFKARTNEKVTSVSALTSYTGSRLSIKVYRLKKKYSSPADGKLVASLSRKVPYSGYHRFDLPKAVKIKKGRSFSVVVKEKTPKGKYCITYLQGISKQDMLNSNGAVDFYAKAVVNRGESYYHAKIKSKYKWRDWKNYTDKLRKKMKALDMGAEVDNFNIKAYYTKY